MENIQLTEHEQKLLKMRSEALERSVELISFRATANTIAALHGAEGKQWALSGDYSTLEVGADTGALNLPHNPSA